MNTGILATVCITELSKYMVGGSGSPAVIGRPLPSAVPALTLGDHDLAGDVDPLDAAKADDDLLPTGINSFGGGTVGLFYAFQHTLRFVNTKKPVAGFALRFLSSPPDLFEFPPRPL